MASSSTHAQAASTTRENDSIGGGGDLGKEALSGLQFAHEQAGMLLDALTRAIHRSNATMSAGSSVNTTPQKMLYGQEQLMGDPLSLEGASNMSGPAYDGTGVRTMVRKFDSMRMNDEAGSDYLQYHQSRSPFGRRRDAADEREALIGIRNKLEDLQQKLENCLIHIDTFDLPTHPSYLGDSLESYMKKIDNARDELLHLALRKIDVVVRERTILEAVIGFTRTGTIELEDGIDDLEHPARQAEESVDVSREDVVSLIHGASRTIWRSRTDEGLADGDLDDAMGLSYEGYVPTESKSPVVSNRTTPTKESDVYNYDNTIARKLAPQAQRSPVQQARRRIFGDAANQDMHSLQKKQNKQQRTPVSVLDMQGVFNSPGSAGQKTRTGSKDGMMGGGSKVDSFQNRLDSLDNKLKIDGALPPSTVCGFPPQDSPIQPSRLSGKATQQQEQEAGESAIDKSSDTHVSVKLEEEGASGNAEEKRRRRGLLGLTGCLVKGVVKTAFKLTFRGVLVVAAASTISTSVANKGFQNRLKALYTQSIKTVGNVSQGVAKNLTTRRIALRKSVDTLVKARKNGAGNLLKTNRMQMKSTIQAQMQTELPVMKVRERVIGESGTIDHIGQYTSSLDEGMDAKDNLYEPYSHSQTTIFAGKG